MLHRTKQPSHSLTHIHTPLSVCKQEFFPLHHYEEKQLLSRKWYRWCSNPWKQPIHHIRAYFGEKVGLYFAFLSHYTKWLLAPSFIGIVV